ncbi:MAG: phosphodiesterase [Spirochaetales bacterium]|nr:phosphodiesterase [Spirochaetales bacterium]
MKWLIASDIHGSAHWCDLLMKAFRSENADRLILLGDLLYHGPRNDLPLRYDPKAVIAMLNGLSDRILAVRGNCEAEVDQMVLKFPVLADYALLPIGDRLVFITHGHLFNEGNLPPIKDGDILLHGHTHIAACIDHGSFLYMNPGSVSIPKPGQRHSYMTLQDGLFKWKDLEKDNSTYLDFKV